MILKKKLFFSNLKSIKLNKGTHVTFIDLKMGYDKAYKENLLIIMWFYEI